MLNLFLRPLRMLTQILVGNATPRQTAWAFSLGMLVGLLPKGNLVAIGLAMLLFGLKLNRGAGVLAIGLFSYVGWALDDTAHRLGAKLLTWEAARPTFAGIYDLPLGPFLGLNNTIVVGQLLIGLYFLYPTYQLSRLVAVRIQPRINQYLMRYRVMRWLRGAELGTQWGLDG